MPKSSLPELAFDLWQWLAVKNDPKKSDLIFLIGGVSLETPKKAFELYWQGLAPYLAVSGKSGTSGNPNWDKPIADIFADFLLENEVPKERLIIQNQSTNTLEDIIFTMEKVAELGIPSQNIIIVSRPFHQRRSLATFQKQFPDRQFCNIPNDEEFPWKDQKQLQELTERCLFEYEKLISYAIKGDLAKQEIPEEIYQTYQKLRLLFKQRA